MDTTDTEITFDQDGHCNHCNDYFRNLRALTYQGDSSDAKLERIVAAIKASGRNSAYDCLIGVSGGLDSSYAAFVLKKLGLRTLCVHLDNGWDSSVSVRNIRSMVGKLGFDYESFVLDWEEFKDLQLSFLRASVPEADTPTDMAIQAVVYETAARHGIKYIISGGNIATEGILPKSWHYDAKDSKYLRAIQERFGTRKLGTFPVFDYRNWIHYKLKGIKTIYLLNLVPYSKQIATRTLETHFSWESYVRKHHESMYTGFIQSYLLVEKFRIDYRLPTLSSSICAGEITREAALAILTQKAYDDANVEKEKSFLCKKLGISVSEFDEIIAAPPRSHMDYPNDKYFLGTLYWLYRKFSFGKL